MGVSPDFNAHPHGVDKITVKTLNLLGHQNGRRHHAISVSLVIHGVVNPGWNAVATRPAPVCRSLMISRILWMFPSNRILLDDTFGWPGDTLPSGEFPLDAIKVPRTEDNCPPAVNDGLRRTPRSQ